MALVSTPASPSARRPLRARLGGDGAERLPARAGGRPDGIRGGGAPRHDRAARSPARACFAGGGAAEGLFAAVTHPGGDGLHPRPVPDLVLDEGLELETLAGHWRVVPAPGHSPTQVMLFDDRSKMLLSADLVLAPPIRTRSTTTRPTPRPTTWPLWRGRALSARPGSAGAWSAQRGCRREDRESPRSHGCRRRACPRADCHHAADRLGGRRGDPRARRAVLPAPGGSPGRPACSSTSFAACRRRRWTGATACDDSKRSV